MNYDYKKHLIKPKSNFQSFDSFMNEFINSPKSFLYTSPSLVAEAIRSFGYKIVIRSGEPVISYSIFSDPFSDGINAIYGQEFCIDKILDIIDSVDQESTPRRGIVFAGPPSSGKTNIIDMITKGIEEYTAKEDVKICTFSILFEKDNKCFSFRSPFLHNPILLIPITSEINGKIIYPRKEFLLDIEKNNPGFITPNYYKNASLDKVTLDILDSISFNLNKDYYDVLKDHVKVETNSFSIAQGKGISNIDDMSKLKTSIKSLKIGSDIREMLDNFIPGLDVYSYDGSLVSSNRGILHIHDAFSQNNEDKYRPLLMLLGSGKIPIESTQMFLDTTVYITTNLNEMQQLENELTSKKLLDRIEKVPVNYLIDSNSEMEILKRDMSGIKDKYDIDPNLIRIASYYSVLTRLFPTEKEDEDFPLHWTMDKIHFYKSLPPEKKLIIYCSKCVDPIKTINSLPPLHQFRNECLKNGINLSDIESFKDKVFINENSITLEESGIFSNEEIKMIDDEFMRVLIKEHYMTEGKYGMSVRQLQNIMRDTITSSDGRKITVSQFLNQLRKIVEEGSDVHYWLNDKYINDMFLKKVANGNSISDRYIGDDFYDGFHGIYGNYNELIDVVCSLYNYIIKKEITIAAVNRDPEKIEKDLRRYIQHVLLYRSSENSSFSKVLMNKYSFIDPITGLKIDKHDIKFMSSIECILCPSSINSSDYRNMIADKFFKSVSSGELNILDGHSIINSISDNLKQCFSKEYSKLLSHSRIMDDINISLLEESFYHKYNSKEKYDKCDAKIKKIVEMIIYNLEKNNGYSKDMALEIIIYALSEGIVEFEDILS